MNLNKLLDLRLGQAASLCWRPQSSPAQALQFNEARSAHSVWSRSEDVYPSGLALSIPFSARSSGCSTYRSPSFAHSSYRSWEKGSGEGWGKVSRSQVPRQEHRAAKGCSAHDCVIHSFSWLSYRKSALCQVLCWTVGCELDTDMPHSALELLHSGGGDRHGRNGSQVSALVRPSKNPTGSDGISSKSRPLVLGDGGDGKEASGIIT